MKQFALLLVAVAAASVPVSAQFPFFRAGFPIPVGPDPRQVIAADLNFDGNPDLVVPSEASRQVSVLIGDGVGGFTSGTTLREVDSPTCAVVADFNGDLVPDLAVFHKLYAFLTGLPRPGVSVFYGNGQGGFFFVAATPVPSVITSAVALDFNRDRRMDLAAASDFSVSVMANNGSASFAEPIVVANGALFTALVTADFNNDGSGDLAAVDNARRNLVVMQARGDGSFLGARAFSTGRNGSPFGLTVVSANADARPDLAQVDSVAASELTIWLNRDGTLFDPATQPTITGAASVAVGDVNLDGRVDLVTAGRGDSRLGFHYGDGLGNFGTLNILPVDLGSPINAVATSDFDRNSRTDLVTVHPQRGELRYLLNGGTETRQRQSIVFNPPGGIVYRPQQVVVLDARATSGLPVEFFSSTPNVCAFQGVTDTRLLIANAGICTIRMSQPGNSVYDVAEPLTANLLVDRAPQSLVFGNIGTRPSNETFTLQATASSGLPVNFTVLAGPARLVGNIMHFTGTGSVSVQAFQDGGANYLPATPIIQAFTVTLGRPNVRGAFNGASYGAVLAPGGFATLFGDSLYQNNIAGNPGDLALNIRDATGAPHRAEVTYAGFGQVNFLVPRDVAPGPAEITATNFAGSSAPVSVAVARIAPGLFSADGSGRGAPAGLATIVRPDLSRTEQFLAECNAGTCTPIPVPAGLGVQTFLSLYATGMRDAASANVEIGGVRCTVLYAGPQGQFPGLDQINIVVPPELAGRGLVSLRMSVDGVFAPELTLSVR